MKRCLFFSLVFLLNLIAQGQTKSDSLYFAKLYPLENGEFLLIGSEVPGSYRKTVIRYYDKNLKIKKQIYDKNMRNSEIFLDEIYPNTWRIISRYRWNKGRVMLYAKDLGLESARFFKRDQYKDWKIIEDEPADYPLRGDEKLKGLDPLFFKDSLCYYFSEKTKTVYLSNFDASTIKPIYIQKSSHLIKDPGTVSNYKFVLTENRRVLFYYSLYHSGKKHNYFTFLDLETKDSDFSGFEMNREEEDFVFHVSDINFDVKLNLIYVGGSFTYSQEREVDPEALKRKPTMQGYFLQAYSYSESKEEFKLTVNFKEETPYEDKQLTIGYRVTKMGVENGNLYAVFEKFRMDEKSVNLKDGMELSGTYSTYTSLALKVVYHEFDKSTHHQFDFPLKFDLRDEKEFKDKQWRTFHDLKGQTIQQLIFQGKTMYGYNDMSVVNTDLFRRKTVYADRNYNYFLCDWSGEEPKYSILHVNKEKSRCYFSDTYFIKFYTTDWGFKLEKVAY